MKQTIVYGMTAWGLLFIPRSRAERLAAIHSALRHSKTWGDFRAKMPRVICQEVMRGIQENVGRFPRNAERFDSGLLPGFCDGDWPAFPAQEMLRWVPQAIQSGFGEIEDTVLNGFYLYLDPEREDEIVAAFREHGYECVPDEVLVLVACGAG